MPRQGHREIDLHLQEGNSCSIDMIWRAKKEQNPFKQKRTGSKYFLFPSNQKYILYFKEPYTLKTFSDILRQSGY